jgi:hypothetical protein
MASVSAPTVRSAKLLLRSARFWALTMTLTALFAMLTPRTAHATCGPCGDLECIIDGGVCYGIGAVICENHQALLSCEYQQGCPTWHYHGPCQ